MMTKLRFRNWVIGVCAVVVQLAAPRLAAATITWDGGGGDAQWVNPANWSGDTLPGSADDVEINAGGARIDVRADVTIGALSMSNGTQLSVEGSGVAFTALGQIRIDGASVYALQGAVVSLQGLSHYDVPEAQSLRPRLRSEGAGSVVDLQNLVSITGSAHYDVFFFIEAISGGVIRMPRLANISDPVDSHPQGGIRILIDGFSSQMDFSSLSAFADNSVPGDSELRVARGGSVTAPLLTQLKGVRLILDEPSAIGIAQIKQITDGALQVSGGVGVFRDLTSLAGSRLYAEGTTLDFPSLTSVANGSIEIRSGAVVRAGAIVNIDGSSFSVSDGCSLSMPLATRYDTPEFQNLRPRWRVDGAGSILDLPGLATIVGSAQYNTYLLIEAVNGGAIRLPKVTNIADPLDGHPQTGIQILSDGFGSIIDLTALTSFVDNTFPGESELEVIRGGRVSTPALTHLKGVRLSLDETTSMPIAQLIQVIDGSLTFRGALGQFAAVTSLAGTRVVAEGATLEFPLLVSIAGGSFDVRSGGRVLAANMVNIDGASLSVSDGGTLNLAAVTRYDTPEFQHLRTRWRVDGAGSTLILPNLVSITGCAQYDSYLYIQAVNGGSISLPQVTNITDPAEGHPQTGIQLQADGFGSVVDLPLATSFVDHSAPGESSLEAIRGGRVAAPNLASLKGVRVLTDDPSGFPLVQIRQLVDGSLTASGFGVRLPQMVSLSGSRIIADRGVLEMPALATIAGGGIEVRAGGTLVATNVSNIDGASITVTDGGVLNLPGVTRCDTPELQHLRPRWMVDGAGSVLNLPNLTSLTGSAQYDTYLYVEARNGGSILMPQVVSIADPIDGHPQTGVQLVCTGEGSLMDLSSLLSFSDHSPPGESRLEALRGGRVLAPLLTQLKGIRVAIDREAALPLGQIRQFLDGTFTLTGVTANLGQLNSMVGSSLIAQGSHLRLEALTTIALGYIDLSGAGTLALPNLTNVDGASLRASGGSRLSLPAVVRSDLPDSSENGRVWWTSYGSGSVLEFPNLVTYTGSTRYNSYSFIEAHDGGLIDLPMLAEILDPVDGPPQSGTQLVGLGFGSVISTPRLQRFFDNQSPPESKITLSGRAAMVVPTDKVLIGVTVIVEAGSMLPPGDADSDGLTNLTEFQRGTNPDMVDTDSDGASDLSEVEAGTNPLDAQSKPTSTVPARQGRYHSADYRTPAWVVDGSEANRVLSYWRASGYHTDLTGLDGYAPGIGALSGVRHSADYRDPAGQIDGSEANRVLSYWRAQVYHPDATGLDGFAPGAGVGTQSLVAGQMPKATLTEELIDSTSDLGVHRVRTRLRYSKRPLGILIKPQLPVGGMILKVSGTGQPELMNNEILLTGNIPDAELEIDYTIQGNSPAANPASGTMAELVFPGLSNPSLIGPGNPGSGDPSLDGVMHTAPHLQIAESGSSVLVGIQEAGSWVLEGSEDLVRWTVLEGGISKDNPRRLDLGTSATGAKFFRARLKP